MEEIRKHDRIQTQIISACQHLGIEAKQEYTVLDYIAGGTDIQLMTAIDFTASNGDPSFPSSLQYVLAFGGLYSFVPSLPLVYHSS